MKDVNCDIPEPEDSVPDHCQQEVTPQHNKDDKPQDDEVKIFDSEKDENEPTDATKEEEIKDDPKSEPCITKISLEEQEEDKDIDTLSKDIDSIYISEKTDLVVNNFEDIDINAESDENEDNMTTPGLGGIHVIKIDDSKYNNGKKVIEITNQDFLDTSNSDCEESDVNTTREDIEDSVDTAPTREFNPIKRNKIEIATTDESYEQEKKKDKEAKRQVHFKLLK